MVQPLGYNDGILLLSLLYSCIDLRLEWDMFQSCAQPIHKWLVVSYACVIGFRLMHLLGMQMQGSINAGEFLLDMRHKTTLPKMLAFCTWLLVLPFFVCWTILGTRWLWQVIQETPQCAPSVTHLWFSGFWLALCYIWIFIHVALGVFAWALERRMRRAEGDLREIEDDDVLSRWGQVSRLTNYRSLSGPAGEGLTPAEIRALPSGNSPPDLCQQTDCEAKECPICITAFEPGDSVRHLPSCGHSFHRSCIDLWLLRRADCPLCKRSVRGEETP